MHVVYESGLEYIQVNLQEVERVFRQQGLSEPDFADLCIHIQSDAPEKLTRAAREASERLGEEYFGSLGMYLMSHKRIYVMTNNRPYPMAPSMKRTLLHEMNHHIRGGYQSGEWDLPYDERPSEIEAHRFAIEQMFSHDVITIPDECTFVEEPVRRSLVDRATCAFYGMKRFLRRWL